MKLSFLIPAHNEEKIIGKALDNLARIKKFYPSIEVLCGLDGCTDNTLEIVRKYKFVKYIILNERGGKPAVLNKLIKLAKGDIIIIHDADWKFECNKSQLNNMVNLFKNPKVGGVAEGSAIFTEERVRKSKSIGYLAFAWETKFITEFQKKYCTQKIGNELCLNPDKLYFLFFVNIFRKKLFTKAITLADDAERAFHILNKGYLVPVWDESLPQMVVTYDTIKISDLFRQKVRTHIARSQLSRNNKYQTSFLKFYIPFYLYMLTHLYRVKRLRSYLAVLVWHFIIFFSFIKAQLILSRGITTKEGWKMRAQRK